jgi:phospholipase D1/2
VLRSYETAIKQAEQYIYIENQYIRDQRIADWIIQQATEQEALQVIIMIPTAPEEVGQETIDPITFKGMKLQYETLSRMLGNEELKGRFGIFSMAAPESPSKAKQVPWDWVMGNRRSPAIYIHSKIMIIDDVWSTIGSANANGRSFGVDTEACIAFYDPTTVRAFRIRLWKEQLGSPLGIETWAPADFLKQWNTLTAEAATVEPAKRKGFAVPHVLTAPTGTISPEVPDFLIPEEFTGLTEDNAQALPA